MSKKLISRRSLLGATATGGAIAAFAGPWKHNRVWAAGSDKPIKIGITSDASGQYANSGASDRRGMMMAIDEANEAGGVLGRKIEFVHLDTETTPATGSRVAERMISREECGFLIGAVSSGVANAISQVAQKYGVIYLNTNSSSPSESGANCHRVKFVWDGNGTNFAKAAVKNAIATYGKNWLLLTNDYVWGHDTAAATRKLLEEYGGTVTEEILVPQGTRDFSAALLKIQQSGPDVVSAAVGGDDQKAMRQQVAQLGMGEKPAWINSQQDWPDVYGLPLDNLFGVFGTTWYYKLDLPGVADFVKKYQERYPDTQMRVPGNVFYNGYMATRELLAAIERAGSTNNIAIIKQLEGHKMPAAERMQHDDAWIDPVTHQVQQTIYLATANSGTQDADDMFKIVNHSSPDAVLDSDAAAACKLESYEDTPTFDA
ncbi:ABC transporter substrate-binding protein [Nitratireductor mangrovi]|uniref:ABC transporter substrate-binding protein n=1 Tax=Nitratireductor mangrovi TaxID=2599600 RepID=A0A5B8KVX9_9HYPH|nr:ABC transporter substrate-binding protein [Nitratireductor mangrovi]QDY99710.1 ABC transporter substrate-binding protein [Nitratireductor mangrovi]